MKPAVWILLLVFLLAIVQSVEGHTSLLPLPQEINYEPGSFPLRYMVVRGAVGAGSEDRFAAQQPSSYLSEVATDQLVNALSPGSDPLVLSSSLLKEIEKTESSCLTCRL